MGFAITAITSTSTSTVTTITTTKTIAFTQGFIILDRARTHNEMLFQF